MAMIEIRDGKPFVEGLSEAGQRRLEDCLTDVPDIGIQMVNHALMHVQENPNRIDVDGLHTYIKEEIERARTSSWLPALPGSGDVEVFKLAEELYELIAQES